jgi:hypothetical protein
MIPVIKGWCTENSVEIASLAVQVHGGMGFIEETGVAQYLRDSRITPIYEGTTGIQANDLVGRKLGRDKGQAAAAVIAEMRRSSEIWGKDAALAAAAGPFSRAVDALESAVRYVVANHGSDFRSVAVGAVPLLKLFGVTAGGWQLLRSAAIARARLDAPGEGGLTAAFYRAKIDTARFYADHLLPLAPALAHTIVHGAAGALADGVL